MIVKLPTEHLLEFLSLKGGCRGLSESTSLVKIPHCWKSHATALFLFQTLLNHVNDGKVTVEEIGQRILTAIKKVSLKIYVTTTTSRWVAIA